MFVTIVVGTSSLLRIFDVVLAALQDLQPSLVVGGLQFLNMDDEDFH